MSPRTLPLPPTPTGGTLVDAHLSILDRQVLDVDDNPVGVVDDLELDDLTDRVLPPGSPPPAVRNLVHGPIVLNRIVGNQRPLGHVARVPWAAIATLESAIHLAVRGDTLDVGWLEDWLATNVIGRIPGGRHVPR
jgi:hypothetical protein